MVEEMALQSQAKINSRARVLGGQTQGDQLTLQIITRTHSCIAVLMVKVVQDDVAMREKVVGQRLEARVLVEPATHRESS